MTTSVNAISATIEQSAADQPPERRDGRRERGRLRQRALIDAARDLFVEVGYRGTTLEALIARAGGSRETIYRVFGGKSGLFSAIIAQSGAEFAASIVEPVALTLPPREGLTRVGLQLAEVWLSDEGRAVNRVVVSEGLDAPELMHAWYHGAVAISVEALARYLEGQVVRGRLQPLDASLVARQFVTLLMGELAFPLIAGVAESRDHAEQVAHCVDLIIRAYQPVG